MYNPSSKQREIIKRTITYTLMTTAVVVLVAFLVMTMLGYRFNRNDGSLVQGGLVQFVSQPSGADVIVNGKDIGSNTTTKMTLEPGEHDVLIQRKNYRDWTKRIDVRAGMVTWLNYARLIPRDLKVETVREFEQLDEALSSPDDKWFALLPDNSQPELIFADLQRDEPQFRSLNLPSEAFTAPKDDAASRFRLSKWTPNGRFLLVEHSYEGKREWIVVDREDASRTRNITTLLSIDATQVEFANNSGRLFYVLEEGNVRRVNLNEATLSRPLINNVKSFNVSLERDELLTYETLPKEGVRELGYYNDGGSDGPVVLKSVEVPASVTLGVAIEKYYDDTYIALAVGDRVEVMRGDLPKSNQSSPLKLVETLELSGNARDLMIKGGGRFIYARSGAEFVAYDLEQKAQYTTRLSAEKPNPQLEWLDEYILWSDFDGELQFYDFDGGNHQKIVPVASGYDVTLARNGRYVYSIGQTDDGKRTLQQVRLIL